jgi:hypothetical protein
MVQEMAVVEAIGGKEEEGHNAWLLFRIVSTIVWTDLGAKRTCWKIVATS